MFPPIRGYRIQFQVDGIHDALIIPFTAAETDADACQVAVLAARHGYFSGAIKITHIDAGRWCPMGGYANPEHTAQYVSP